MTTIVQSNGATTQHTSDEEVSSLKFDTAVAKLAALTNWEQLDRRRMCLDWSLAPVLDLLHRLGSPQHQFKVVHVAGTKGKGSVCSLVERGLVAAGVRTGRYASPHIECLTERISLNGRCIPKRQFGEMLAAVLAVRQMASDDGTPAGNATAFDILTACAFVVFARSGVEWAVVECGLGGRLDSTNVVQSSVSVITNIDLEHTEILGDTKAKIAAEKAGIISPGSAVLTGVDRDSEEGAVITDRCDRLHCALRFVDATGSISDANTNLAVATLREIAQCDPGRAIPLGPQLQEKIIAQSHLPGRMELRGVRMSGDGVVDVLLDGAHVPSSLARVLSDVMPSFRGRRCVGILGLGRDKDAVGMVRTLAPFVDLLITTQISAAAYDRFELKELAVSAGVRATTAASPREALELAARAASGAGWVIVTGSLHLVGAIRPSTDPLHTEVFGGANPDLLLV